MREKGTTRGKRLLRWIQWALLVVILVGIVSYVRSHIDDFAAVLRLRPLLIAQIIVVYVGLTLIDSLQLYAVLWTLGLRMPLRRWLEVFAYARILNRFVPQSGNAYRAATLKMFHDLPLSHYVAGFASFAYLYNVLALSFSLVTIALFRPTLAIAGVNVAAVLGAMLVVAVLAGVLGRRLASLAAPSIREGNKLFRSLAHLMDGVSHAISRPRLILQLVAAGMVIFVFDTYLHWLCFDSLGTPLDVAQVAAVRAFNPLMEALSITPGNLGLKEVAYGFLSEGLESAAASGMIVAAVVNVTTFLAYLVFGGVLGILWLVRPAVPARSGAEGR